MLTEVDTAGCTAGCTVEMDPEMPKAKRTAKKQTKAARKKFTKKYLDSLVDAPPAKRRYYYDETQPKLAICIQPTGNAAFYCIKKFNEPVEQSDGATIEVPKTVRFRLGAYPDVSIERARDKCVQALAKLSDGKNPQADKKAASKVWTLRKGFEYYIKHHARTKNRSWKVNEQRFNRHCTKLASRRLTAIKTTDIQELHTAVSTKWKDENGKVRGGEYEANRLLSLLSKVFNFLTKQGHFHSANPAKGIQRCEEQERERVLEDDEIGRFFEALDAEQNPDLADVFRLMIWTGARKHNVAGMAWEELHLDRGEWIIPAERFKNGRPMKVQLSPEVVDVLRGRRESQKQSEKGLRQFVFPSRAGTKSGHITDVARGWERVCTAAKLDGVRSHDLRRTFLTRAAEGGSNEHMLMMLAGHRSTQSTQVYIRIANKRAAQATVATVSSIMKHVGKKKAKA